MSYLLESPPSSPHPTGLRGPPYALFAINGESIVDILPPRIPLRVVLHYIPALEEYALPAPVDLPHEVAKATLITPFRGINIRLDIGKAAFQRITCAVLKSAGCPVPHGVYYNTPSIITSASIVQTWSILKLPSGGLANLTTHMSTTLMMNAGVDLASLDALFTVLPAGHEVLHLAATSFVQGYVDFVYSHDDFLEIRKWYAIEEERKVVFRRAEGLNAEFGKLVVVFERMREMVNDGI